ncbi:hypothetical protein AMTRI_Chr09g21030 [Amborella trichopoda]
MGSNSFFCSSDEAAVAEILVDFIHHLWGERKKSHNHAGKQSWFCWGAKKRRSALSFSTDSSSPLRYCNGWEGSSQRMKIRSPSSPLSPPLSLSQSGSETVDAGFAPLKPKRPRKRGSKKKSHKELKEMVAQLLAEQQKLKLDIVKFKELSERLSRLNSQLKDWHTGVSKFEPEGLSTMEPEPEALFSMDLNSCRGLDVAEELEASVMDPSSSSSHFHLFPMDNHITEAKPIERPASPVSSSLEEKSFCGSRPEKVLCNFAGREINTVADETLSLNISFHYLEVTNKAAIAAQARRRRIDINRVKNSLSQKPRSR